MSSFPTRSIKLYNGSDATPVNDFTAEEWTDWAGTELASAADGVDSTTSTWVVRDEGGVIPDNAGGTYLQQHNVVVATVGSNTLWRGRVDYLERKRGRQVAGRAAEFTVNLSDANSHLNGIVVHDWSRPEESVQARAQALVAAYLSGSPRPTTNLNGSNLIITGSNTVTVAAKTYSGVTPSAIMAELAELADLETFVSVDNELALFGHDYAGYASQLRISDDPADLNANTCVPITPSQTQDGRDSLTALRVYWGGATSGDYHTFHRVDNTREALNDYWEDVYYDSDSKTWAEASNRATNVFNARKRDDTTYEVMIGAPGTDKGQPMSGDDIYKVKAGQLIQFKSLGARGGRESNGSWTGDTFLTRRIREVRWTFTGVPDQYFATLTLDRPRHRIGASKVQPKATTPQPAPPCLPDEPGAVLVEWDFEEHGFDPNSWDTTGTYDSHLLLTDTGSPNCPNATVCGYNTASHRGSDEFAVDPSTSYVFTVDVKWLYPPGVRDIWVKYDGTSGTPTADEMLVDGSNGYTTGVAYSISKTFTTPVGATSARIVFNPYSGTFVDNMKVSELSVAAVNDPNCVDYGEFGN